MALSVSFSAVWSHVSSLKLQEMLINTWKITYNEITIGESQVYESGF